MNNKNFDELVKRYPCLSISIEDVKNACAILISSVKADGKILLCGNGGSSADCEHISGELLKGFLLKRPLSQADLEPFSHFENGVELGKQLQYGICTLPLSSFSSLYTAFCNDVSPDAVYAQLVMAMGKAMDAIICISTSGNAKNIINAAITAKSRGLKVIGLTGESGGALASLCDCCIKVPETETFMVQELHLPVYHCICSVLESEFFE